MELLVGLLVGLLFLVTKVRILLTSFELFMYFSYCCHEYN